MSSILFFQPHKLHTTRMNQSGSTISYTVVGKKAVSIGELTGSKVRFVQKLLDYPLWHAERNTHVYVFAWSLLLLGEKFVGKF